MKEQMEEQTGGLGAQIQVRAGIKYLLKSLKGRLNVSNSNHRIPPDLHKTFQDESFLGTFPRSVR